MGKYDSRTIENRAVDKLSDMLERTGLVDASQVQKNDKTPSWDGDLLLYPRTPFKKSELSGKIPVQVKGKFVKKYSAFFPLSVADLRNYFRDQGVMLFVVEFVARDSFHIYYRALLPFDLKTILDDLTNKKTKSIQMDSLSGKTDQEILQILSAFVENRSVQGKLLDGVKNFSDFKRTGIQIKQMGFIVPTIGIETKGDAFKYFLENPQYIYVVPQNTGGKFPVDIITLTQIAEMRNIDITVDGKTIFDKATVVHKANEEMIFQLSPCLSFPLGPPSHQISFQLDGHGTLGDQITSLSFLIALLERRDVQIEGRPLDFQDVQFDCSSYEEMKDRLSWLLDVRKTLDLLHIKKQLEWEQIDACQADCLAALVDGILYGQPVPFSSSEDGGVGRLVISNLTITLLLEKKTGGKYISDAYQVTNPTLSFPTADGGEISFPGSIYAILTADLLLRDDNIDFDHMVDAITAFPYSEHYASRLFFFNLELLNAYDRSEPKEGRFLEIALELYAYLLNHDDSADTQMICQVNVLQIEKRRRALSTDENLYLIDLKNAVDTPTRFRLAAAVLLESFVEASHFYNQMGEEERKEFDSFPISHLWPRDLGAGPPPTK